MEQLNKFKPYALALLRIVAGYTFMLHGTAKHFALPHIAMFDQMPTFSLFGIGGFIEMIGGLLLILGLFTRPAAFIMAGQMAVAYFMFHASADTFWLPLLNQGEPAVLFCFIFFYIVFAGPGALALDNIKKKKS